MLDAVGATATRQAALAAVRPGGVVVHVGLHDADGTLDVRRLTLSEVAFLGSYTYTPDDLRTAVALLASGALGDLSWVESRPLSEGATAFSDLAAGRVSSSKVVLIP